MMDHSSADSLTYNLRLVRGTDADTWRITLYDARTGTYQRFASLVQLDAFLHRVTRSAGTNEPPAQQADAE